MYNLVKSLRSMDAPLRMNSVKLSVLPVLMAALLTACATTPQRQMPAPNPEAAAKARTGIAARYIMRDDLDAAQRHLEQALDSKSDYAPAHNLMGVLLQRAGGRINLAKAEDHFKRAIRLDRGYAQAHNNYGVYLSQMKRDKEALEQFEIASSSLGYEGRAGAFENLGRTAMRLAQFKLAEQAFLNAIEINNKSLIARLELVDIYLNTKKYAEAQHYYDQYMQITRNSPKGARSLYQGIKLATHRQDIQTKRTLTDVLLQKYPLSKEAKKIKRQL